jgi:hypothetical protein
VPAVRTWRVRSCLCPGITYHARRRLTRRSCFRPDTVNHRTTHAVLGGGVTYCRCGARSAAGCAFGGNCVVQLPRDGRPPTATWRISQQDFRSAFQEPPSPENDGSNAGRHFARDTPNRQAVRRKQYDPAPQHEPLGSRASSDPLLQLFALRIGQRDCRALTKVIRQGCYQQAAPDRSICVT